MTVLNVATLIDEEELHFEPTDKPFNVEEIIGRLLKIGFAFRDDYDPAMIMILENEELRQACRARRRASQDQEYPYVLLVYVKPDRIDVSPVNDKDYAHLSIEVIEWLWETQQCKVTNDRGTDVRVYLNRSNTIEK